MTCKHEILTIHTTELVGQRYYNEPQPEDPNVDFERWGKTLWQTIKSVDRIECDDCGKDLTDELRDKIDW